MHPSDRMSYLHMTTSYGYTYAIHKTRLGHTPREGYHITVTNAGGCCEEVWGGTLEESVALVMKKIAFVQETYDLQGKNGDGQELRR